MCIFRYLNVYKGRKDRKGALKKFATRFEYTTTEKCITFLD